jgi:hypothetical protein
MQSAPTPGPDPRVIPGWLTSNLLDSYDGVVDAAKPGVPAVVGKGGPSTNSPDTPDGRLHQLLEELRAALERLDLTTTRRQLARLELHAEHVDAGGPGRATFFARACRAMFALTEGDLVGAASMTDEAARIGTRAALPEAEAVVRTLRNDRARQLGDREGMATGAAWCEARAARERSTAARAEAAVLWLASGDVARAGRLVDTLQAQLEYLPDDDQLLLVLSRVCEAAVGTGRRVAASTAARLLEPFAHRAVVAPGATAFGGVVDDFIALATGDREAAARARTSYEQLGAWWWARRRTLDVQPSTSFPRVLHLHPSHRNTGVAQWCVGPDGQTRQLTAMPGLEYLRQLLHQPGRDVSADELARADAGPDPRRRIIVRQAIATALSRLDMVDPELGGELRATIRTGLSCRYDPDPLRPTAWHLETDVSHAAH